MSLPENFYQSANEPPVIFMPERDAENLVYALQCRPDGGAVRVIRGWKCLNQAARHDEVAAALQFPGYYGENWDAMDECITDLGWMPARWYLIHLNRVERVLPGDEKGFGVFMSILRDAGRAWARPESRRPVVGGEGLVRPFNTIISGPEEGLRRAGKALGLDARSAG